MSMYEQTIEADSRESIDIGFEYTELSGHALEYKKISSANNLGELAVYFDSKDTQMLRLAFIQLGDLVTRKVEESEELRKAWNAEGIYSHIHDVKNDLIRVKLAYYRLKLDGFNRELVEYLYSLKDHKDETVRHDVINALKQIGGSTAVKILANEAVSDDKVLSFSAISALSYRWQTYEDEDSKVQLEKLVDNEMIRKNDLVSFLKAQVSKKPSMVKSNERQLDLIRDR